MLKFVIEKLNTLRSYNLEWNKTILPISENELVFLVS